LIAEAASNVVVPVVVCVAIGFPPVIDYPPFIFSSLPGGAPVR